MARVVPSEHVGQGQPSVMGLKSDAYLADPDQDVY